MFNRLLIFCLLFVSVGFFVVACRGDSGSQGKWKFIGKIKDPDGNYVSVFLDLSKIEINDTKRKFWIKYMAAKGDASGEEYMRQLGYWEVDCLDKSLYRLGEEYYSPDSRLLGRSEEKVREEYSSYESLGAKMTDVACKYAGR